MDKEKLKALKERAAKATIVAEELEVLNKHSRFAGSLKFTMNGYEDIYPRELLGEVFDQGRKAVIAAKEVELAELLGETQPQVIPMPSLVGPYCDDKIGTLDTCDLPVGDGSDTWEQPA